MGFMPTDKKQKDMLTIGVIALVLAFGFYFFRFKKVKASYTALEAEVVLLKETQQKLEADEKRYGNAAKMIKTYEQHMKRLEELIPREQDVPGLLLSIAEQAQVANVSYLGINPLLEEPVAYYTRQVYDVTINGQYHDIGNYLAGIASLRRIIKTGEMRVAVDANAKPNKNGGPTLRAVFSVETFVIPSPGAVKPDSVKKGA